MTRPLVVQVKFLISEYNLLVTMTTYHKIKCFLATDVNIDKSGHSGQVSMETLYPSLCTKGFYGDSHCASGILGINIIYSWSIPISNNVHNYLLFE